MPVKEATQPEVRDHSLDDEHLQRFIVEGYLSVRTEHPPEFHQALREQIEAVIGAEGNPGNNLLPRLPALREVFHDAPVAGALGSILGPGYFLQPHRYCHLNSPGTPGQKLHRDGFCTRRHHPRAVMAFYYPQDVTEAMGPTAIVPRSQYSNTRPRDAELLLCADAGAVVLVDFNIWHRGTPNVSDRKRAMVKFLFTRMEEPWEPGGSRRPRAWRPGGVDPLSPLWEHLWGWHCGGVDGFPDAGRGEGGRIPQLVGALSDESELVGFHSAYELARIGAPAVPALVEALLDAPDAGRWHPIHEGINDGSFPRFVTANASYALSAIGAAAVPALLDAITRSGRPLDWAARASVVETLADIGRPAHEAIPVLRRAVEDESVYVRRHAAEALGTTSQGLSTGVLPLMRSLTDEDIRVRRNATLALARIGAAAEEAVPLLARSLADDDRYVRGNAAHALRCIRTPAAVEVLLEYMATSRWCPLTTRDSPY
jgi:HEAT repeat protein